MQGKKLFAFIYVFYKLTHNYFFFFYMMSYVHKRLMHNANLFLPQFRIYINIPFAIKELKCI